MNQYLINWFIWLDQGVNMFRGGDPDVTISSECGYHSYRTAERYWRWLESLIDWAFKPIDGPKHCWQAYEADPHERFKEGGKLSKALLMIAVLFWLPPIALAIRIYKLTGK